MKSDNSDNNVKQLEHENKILKIKLNQLKNENYILNSEYDENTEKYLDMVNQLEIIVNSKTEKLKSKIKELEIADQRLVRKEKKYRLLVEYANDGIIMVSNGQIVFVNPAFQKMIENRDFIGKPILSIFPKEEQRRVKTLLDVDLNYSSTSTFIDSFIYGHDSVKIPIEINTAKLSDSNDTITIFFIRDISMRILIQKEQEIAQQQKSVLALAVTANHELNQPLMVIQGNMELLQSTFAYDSPNEKQRKYLTRIKDSITRINNILKTFRELNTIDFTDYTAGVEMVELKDE